MRFTLKVGFLFYFKKFRVKGRENINRKKAVIYLPNHENTFMDALAVAASSPKMSHYMARADIFSSPFLIWLMATINLRPIYRIRDGKKAVAKNQQVFIDLQNYLSDGEYVMIHPEGTHNLEYWIRPLSKGFTRLVFGFMEKFPEQELDIVPVGINYSNHTDYRSNISIEFGKPIDARTYLEMEDRNRATAELVEKVSLDIKSMVTHIEPGEEYDTKYQKLSGTYTDFSKVEDTHAQLAILEKGEELKAVKPKKANIFERALYPLVFLNNILLVLLWRKMKPTFKDKAWYGPIKLSVGTFLGPWIYLGQTAIVYAFFGPVWALLYLFFSLISISILRLGQQNTSY